MDATLRDAIIRDSSKLQWPSKRVLRRWFCLTERKLQHHHDTQKMLTIYESRRAWLEPKLRLHLPKEAYDVFLHIFEDKTKIAEPLEALGVIRDVGDATVQFWCADACLQTEPMMQAMLNEAKYCRDNYEANEIRVAMHYSSPLIMKLTNKLTLVHVRNRVEKCFQIKTHKQVLTHKGQQLFHGLLWKQGVTRGSVIIVSEHDHMSRKKMLKRCVAIDGECSSYECMKTVSKSSNLDGLQPYKKRVANQAIQTGYSHK